MTHSPLGIRTELLLSSGTWENITPRIRGNSGIRINRGRRDERGRTVTSLGLTLEDLDGDFNDLNPLSSYYGLIGPNTQLRVTRGDSAPSEDSFGRTITNGWNTWHYTFDATADGWVGEGATSVARVTTAGLVHDGAGSLRATKTMGAGFDSLRFNDNSGLANDISANGDTVAVWALVPAGAAGSGWLAHIEVQNSSFTWIPGTDVSMTPGTWTLLTFTPPAGLLADCRAIGMQFSATGVGGSQSVYIDTVRQYNSTTTPLWELSGGTVPDDYDVNGDEATQTNTDTNVLRYATVSVGEPNHRVRSTFNFSAADITGAAATVFLLARVTNTSNYYAITLSYSTAEVVTMTLHKRVAGVLSAIGSSTTVATFTGAATTALTAELYVEGSRLYAKAWSASVAEPEGWQLVDTDTELTTGDGVGIASRRETSNTNANLQMRCDNLLAVPGTIRAHVEVPNWGASRWTTGGSDVTMAIQGAGIKRRLGSSSLRSPMYRSISALLDSGSLIGYWPCEDGPTGGQIASGIPGGPPLNVFGMNASFGASSPFPGSASMISVGEDTSLSASLVSPSGGTALTGQLLVTFPEAGLADDTTVMAIFQIQNATIRKWYLQYQGSTGGSLRIVGYDQTFAAAETSAYQATNLNGRSALIVWSVAQDGADVDWTIDEYRLASDGSTEASSAFSGTFTSSSVGSITAVAVGPAADIDGCSVSHIAVSNSLSTFIRSEAATSGHFGESAAVRFARLCGEEDIAYEIVGEEDAVSSIRMGPQRISSLLQNLDDVEDAEHGIVYEARHFFGLVLRTHERLLDQTGPNFPYTDGYLTGEPFPEPDDLLIANDVTASRSDGTSRRAVLESGAMSVQNPPNGIGRYARTSNANVGSGALLADVAGWDLHVGTWRGARYPNITFETHRSQFTVSVTADVDELDLGDYFSIDDTPAWLHPDEIEVLAQGYTEEIYNLTRKIVFNCIPAGPYFVPNRGGDFVRDSSASTLDAQANAGATSLSVAVTGPLWETGSQDFNIFVAGSVLHVTDISGASSPQTFTVDATRVNGIDKDLPSGSEVHVHPLPVRALTDFEYGESDLLEDTSDRPTGLDMPPAVWAEGDTTGVFTSATFSPGTEVVGVVGTLPRSGRIMVHIAGELDNDAAGTVVLTFSVRSGPVIGQGALLGLANDDQAVILFNVDAMRTSASFLVDLGGSVVNPGQEYNVRLEHRRVTAGNATVKRRLLLVRPAGTHGGLPGSDIGTYPTSVTNTQEASDTSTSTSYTTADMTTCGVAFTAAESGKALISFAAQIDNSGANSTYVSFRVGTGSTLNAGSSVVAAADAQSLENFNTNQFMGGRTFLVTGLTGGDSYNAVLLHRVTAGTGTLENRVISVEPVF